jgi:hypothetical protein
MIGSLRSARAAPITITALLLIVRLIPLPGGTARGYLRSARTPEMNLIDREASAGGYYEGIIGGLGSVHTSPSDIDAPLHTRPAECIRFHDIKALRTLRHDPLQFDLKPNIDRVVFGSHFTTNAHGMRDRPYAVEKPEGTIRIALLGSSIDMGWGVSTDETYENCLEDWLNAHAVRRGLSRRFEVLNFAIAAYAPLQRLESFGRKAARFEPDVVLYSATMLDTRLLEIYLCNMLERQAPVRRDIVLETLNSAGVSLSQPLDGRGDLLNKEAIKAALKPRLWDLNDATIGALATECRSRGIEVAVLIVPRVGVGDGPEHRASAVARHTAIAGRHAVPVLDLSPTFDDLDGAGLQIGVGDDHPNAKGHKMLFRTLARALVKEVGLYRRLFGVDP